MVGSRGGRGLRRAVSVSSVSLLLLVAGCGDDGATPTVSEEAYADNVEAACDRHGPDIAEASETFLRSSRSDADKVGALRADLAPRVRAVIDDLAADGFPAAEDTAYREALNGSLTALSTLEGDPYTYLDRRTRGELDDDTDWFAQIGEGFEAAEIPCAPA